MKQILTFFLCLCALTGFANGYKVSEIPNVHLADSTCFVTNPDGVLTPEAEVRLNEMLHSLMQQTSAEVACVAVNDIDADADIDDFATELFRTWGLGKKDNNNGLLLLVAKDRRKYAFRTGNGLEGLLPDGLLGTIARKEMVPRFKENDFGGGIVAAMTDVCGILSSPEAREEVMSKYGNNEKEAADFFKYYLFFCAALAGVCLLWLLYTASTSGKLTRLERYQAADKLYTPMLFLTFLGLGLPLIPLLILIAWRHDLRRGKHLCPDCGTRMKLVDEVTDNQYLERSQDVEERIGAVDYDVWLCPKCGETEIIPYVQKSAAFTQCPVCHARTLHVVSDRIVKQPTTQSTGLRVITSRCVNCGFEDAANKTIAKVAATPPVIIIPGGFGGRGGGGGGFGGGSFGGGTTSGGGVSGGW